MFILFILIDIKIYSLQIIKQLLKIKLYIQRKLDVVTFKLLV